MDAAPLPQIWMARARALEAYLRFNAAAQLALYSNTDLCTSVTGTLSQVRFRTADGHREVLWTQPEGGHYRVLNVPVWLYGISVGTLVSATAGEPWKEFGEIITPSTGGTVRLFVPDDAPLTPASRFYLEQMLPECQERRLPIGPATFFDPLVVAVHIRNRDQWNKAYATYLDDLVARGSIRFWEVGDPDAYPPEEPDEVISDSELVHPPPTPNREIPI